MPLNSRQLDQLFREINPSRVAERKGMAYLETFDVLAHLTRIFGIENWDKEVRSLDCVFEEQRTGEKRGWDVCYRAVVRLTIRDAEGSMVIVHEDAATGSAANQPVRADAHDLAVKSAVSDALKRAAKDLGNQFGLSLYDKGSLKSVVGKSLAYDETPPEAPHDPEKVREQVAGLRDRMLGERKPEASIGEDEAQLDLA
jgi:recombination DNA repair RAD52 pathway protein